MTDYKKYINALRQCAKEHEGERTSTGQIVVSNLCKDTAELLEGLEQEPCETQMIDKSNLSQEQYKADLQSAYDCGRASVKPCEDAISRADAVRVASGYCHPSNIAKELAKLPPVQPKIKTGHWIYDKSIENWRCSECNETPKTMGYCGSANFMAKHFKFCNHCGVRMIES